MRAERFANIPVFTSEEFCGVELPLPEPLDQAVEEGVFGYTEEGFSTPSEDEVRTLTQEHARELLQILTTLAHLTHCSQRGISPTSSRPITDPQQRQAAYQAMNREALKLAEHYGAMIQSYADAFGMPAGEFLDRSLQAVIDSPIQVPLPEPEVLQQPELFS